MRTLQKREWIAIGVAIVAAAILFFGGSIWDAFFPKASEVTIDNNTLASTASDSQNNTSTNQTAGKMKNISTNPGIEIYDKVVGTGAEAVAGKTVSVHYVGTFAANGEKFDSSVDRGQPFSFVLGSGMVIQGWDIGVAGMKVGGTRQLVIAPELGYGPNDYHTIPGGSTLIFEVQLLGVK